MGLYYLLKKDQFKIQVRMKSLLTSKDVTINMLYDTGAQVSSLSRSSLGDLGLFELREQGKYDILKSVLSHSGGIAVASGAIYKTSKIRILSIELIDAKKFKSIVLNSDNMYFDFHSNKNIEGSDILGLDLIKYLESKISINHNRCGLSITKPDTFDYQIIDNRRGFRTDNIQLSNNEIDHLFEEDEIDTNMEYNYILPDLPGIDF